MHGRLYAICRGEAPGVDAATAAKYRALWARQGTAQADGPAPPAKPCRFLGRRARNPDRSVKTRDCGPG